MKTILIQTLKYTAISALFLSFFIVPFLLFGHSIEEFARSFFESDSNHAISILLAGVLLAGDPVLPTPSSVVATLLAAKAGFWTAALVNATALSLACIIGFALGRSGGAAMKRFGRELPPHFVDWVTRHGLVAVLLCRPVPVLAEASLILAGAARHEPRRLLTLCCLTQVMLGIAYAFAGSGWGKGDWNNAAILTGSVGIPLAAAIVVLLSSHRRTRRLGSADEAKSKA